MRPLFSILIPSIPSRFESHFLPLYRKLEKQVSEGEWDIEILSFLDNKKRSIGYKREALVQSARGGYLAFVDDDDEVSDQYVSTIGCVLENALDYAAGDQTDVFVFDQYTTLSAEQTEPVVIKFGINLPNTEVQVPGGATRKPWIIHPWRTDLAKEAHFPDASYGEDAYWLQQLWPKVRDEFYIQGPPLHHYRFRPNVTEAAYTFPPPTGLT